MYEEYSDLKAAVFKWVLPAFVPGTKTATTDDKAATCIFAAFATSHKNLTIIAAFLHGTKKTQV